MEECEAIQVTVNQAVTQGATAVVKVLREGDAGPNQAQVVQVKGRWQRQRHGRPALKQHLFSWNATDMYLELINFEMKVTNILQTKTYELTEEEKVPIIKNG